MGLVVDASVAVKWFIEEEGSHSARSLLLDDEELHVPRLLVSEVANALWRKARKGEIGTQDVGVLMVGVARLPVIWSQDEGFGAEAVRLALALDRPVYDCVYLALAHRLDTRLVTADQRFANALASTEHGGAVVTLADYVS